MTDMCRTWREDIIDIFDSERICIKVSTSYTLNYLLISLFVRYSEINYRYIELYNIKIFDLV